MTQFWSIRSDFERASKATSRDHLDAIAPTYPTLRDRGIGVWGATISENNDFGYRQDVTNDREVGIAIALAEGAKWVGKKPPKVPELVLAEFNEDGSPPVIQGYWKYEPEPPPVKKLFFSLMTLIDVLPFVKKMSRD